MYDPHNSTTVVESAQKFIKDVRQNKVSMDSNSQIETMADSVKTIMEEKRIATPRSSLVVNDLLVLSEELQKAAAPIKPEGLNDNHSEVKYNYPNSYENENNSMDDAMRLANGKF